MASKLEVLIKQALVTFQNISTKSVEEISSELSILRKTVESVSLKDVNIPRQFLSREEPSALKLFKPPKVDAVNYVEIYEDSMVTIGIFVLKQGARLPLHDHPMMHGIIKVLHGTLKITSYSVVDVDSKSALTKYEFKNNLEVRKHPDITMTNRSETCLLTPIDRNLHEIVCLEGPAAFLDVLSPPYSEDDSNDPRSCHYFKESADYTSDDCDIKLLTQIPCPHHLFINVEDTSGTS